MKTIREGKVQHTINCREETWDNLTEFKDQNDLPDYGTVLDFMADFFLKFKDQLDATKEREAVAAQAIEDAAAETTRARSRQSHLDRRQKELENWEKLAADERGVPYLPVVAAKKLLEAGLGVADIQDLHRAVIASGVPVADLAKTFTEIGGAIELLQRLKAQVENLTEQRNTLAATYTVELRNATDALAAAAAEVKARKEEAAKSQVSTVDADKYIGTVREYAAKIEHAYRMLGVVLNGPVTQQLTAGKVARVEHLPFPALLFLAGSVVTIATELYGDQVIDLPRSAENMVPIRIRLSEIPAWFAPVENYRAQMDLVMNQLELMAQYRNGEAGEDV